MNQLPPRHASSSIFFNKRFQPNSNIRILTKGRNNNAIKKSVALGVLFLFSVTVLFSVENSSGSLFQQIIDTTKTHLSYEQKSHTHGELEEGKYHGRYPHSLLTLFYPYTLLRDIVLDQPIDMTDIPFFWHLHNSDERVYKKILTKCYGLELIELNDVQSIEKAIEVNLVSGLHRSTHVITSPFIRETAEVFTTDNFGRMICFFRHPLDYDIHPSLPRFARNDNWLTRLLSNTHEDDVTYKELGVAKQVVRQTCLVGTLDKMKQSIIRFQEHWGWKYYNGMSKEEGEKCVDNAILEGNVPDETWMDHESEEFITFYESNKMDCQLYELAQSAWRHQIQTIVPWNLQLSRAEDDDEENEE